MTNLLEARINFHRLVFSTFQSFGFLAFCRDVVERLRSKFFSSQKFSLFQLDLPFHANGSQPSDINITVGPPERLMKHVDQPEYELEVSFLKSLPHGVLAVCAVCSDSLELVAYGFMSQEVTPIIGELNFAPVVGSAYLFKFFVVDSFRGKGLLKCLISSLLTASKEKNINTLYAIIMAANFNSLRAFKALGFRLVKSFLVGPKRRGIVAP